MIFLTNPDFLWWTNNIQGIVKRISSLTGRYKIYTTTVKVPPKSENIICFHVGIRYFHVFKSLTKQNNIYDFVRAVCKVQSWMWSCQVLEPVSNSDSCLDLWRIVLLCLYLPMLSIIQIDSLKQEQSLRPFYNREQIHDHKNTIKID